MRTAVVAVLVATALGLAACGNDGSLQVTPAQTPVGVPANTPVPTATQIPGDE